MSTIICVVIPKKAYTFPFAADNKDIPNIRYKITPIKAIPNSCASVIITDNSFSDMFPLRKKNLHNGAAPPINMGMVKMRIKKHVFMKSFNED